MTKLLSLRVVWTAAVAALVACGGRSPLASHDAAPGDASASSGGGDLLVRGDAQGPMNGDGARDGGDATIDATIDATADAVIDATTDALTDAAPPTPLDLPGIVLWLDADDGIQGAGTDQMTWTDRSMYQHVFVAQSADGQMPTLSRLNGHRVVRFSGRNRFISEYAPSAAQQEALSLGRDYVVAMLFLLEHEATRESILTTAMLPWIASPPQGTVPPISPATFAIELQMDSSLSFRIGAASLHVEGSVVRSAQLMIMSTVGGNQLRVRANGQVQTASTQAVPDPEYGDYAPVFLGAWDFDTPGFAGIVAEMIIVRGPADQATEQALEKYLKAKFSL